MAGILSGLSSLGLGNLDGMDIFGDDKPEKKPDAPKAKPLPPKATEKDLIYDKTFECPVCGKQITSKVMKTGKTKMISSDDDLRPVYEGIDSLKYDVITCPICGFSALSRYFGPMPQGQRSAIRNKVSQTVHLRKYDGDIYSHEDAEERYKLALVCAVVKQAKASEKALICLRSGWLMRGHRQYLEVYGSDEEFVTEQEVDAKIKALETEENAYLQNALDGFVTAYSTEEFPIGGMDHHTMDYLIATLAFRFGKLDMCAKRLSEVLVAKDTKPLLKNKALLLKEKLVEEVKKTKG